MRSKIALLLCVGAATLLPFTKGTAAEVSEIDAFQRAVTTQSEADALAFFRDFESSHLAADLVELLQQNVALEVCSGLSGASSPARTACEKVERSAVATAPAAVTPSTAPLTPAHPADSTSLPVLKIPPTEAPSAQRLPVAAIAPGNVTLPHVPPANDEPPATSGTQYSGKTIATAGSLPMPYDEKILRKLTARFELRPFRVESLDRQRGELVVTYAGGLGRYVMCGPSIGVVKHSDAVINSADRLNSRIVIRLPDVLIGLNRPYVTVSHIVSLEGHAAGSLDVIDVRLDTPARSSDGVYCWSTGEMERLARLR